MKNFLLAAAFLLSPVIGLNQAQAMHSYAIESCIAKSIENATVAVELGNNRITSPHQIDIRTSNIDADDSGLPFYVNLSEGKDSFDESAADSDLVLKPVSEIVIAKEKINDGCFEGNAIKSVRKMKVVKVSKKLNAFYSLRKNETLVFSCYFSFQEPIGKKCSM